MKIRKYVLCYIFGATTFALANLTFNPPAEEEPQRFYPVSCTVGGEELWTMCVAPGSDLHWYLLDVCTNLSGESDGEEG